MTTKHGVPSGNAPIQAQLQGKVNRAGFSKLTEPRNRKERRKMEKKNKPR